MRPHGRVTGGARRFGIGANVHPPFPGNRSNLVKNVAARGIDLLIDHFLPAYDARERHRIEIRASHADVYAAVRRLDMSRARLSRLLMRLRGMRADALDDFLRERFAILAERQDEELLLGLVGRFWSLSGGLCEIDAETFLTFNEPGSARAAWNFTVTTGQAGTTILSTETRVQCTDAAARRRFRIYWMLVRPFSGLIRRDILRELKRQAEASTTLAT